MNIYFIHMMYVIMCCMRFPNKGRYNIGNVAKAASMSMLTIFESRYTLKGRYSIGNVDKAASMSILILFESRYTLKERYSIGNVTPFETILHITKPFL